MDPIHDGDQDFGTALSPCVWCQRPMVNKAYPIGHPGREPTAVKCGPFYRCSYCERVVAAEEEME